MTTPGLTAGQCVHSNSSSVVDDAPCPGRKKYIEASSSSITLTNTDCGSVISPGTISTEITITTPSAPLANCELTFAPNLNGFYINFNGKYAKLPGIIEHVTKWTIPVVDAFRTNNPSLSLQFVDDPGDSSKSHWEESAVSSPLYQTTVKPSNAAQLVHSQIYFKWNSSASRFELCPQNGPGGVIVDGAMRQIPIDCITLTQGATASSSLNYFYATYTNNDNLMVTQVGPNASSKVALTFVAHTVLGNSGDQVAISCHSVDGDLHANVNDAGVIVSDSEIDLLHTSSSISSVVMSGGYCSIVRLSTTTTGHVTGGNGVEIMNASPNPETHYTLVGLAYIGASNAVNDSATKRDVASWFNRRTKTCINSYTADRTISSTNWTEPNTEIRCEFVVFDDADENAKIWSIAGMFGNNASSGGTLVGASIDAAASVPLTEVVGEKGLNAPLSVQGSVSGLSEGKHFITLYTKTMGAGTSTIFGTTPATSLEIQLWQ